MKDILHSLCLRHDNTVKSLTKQALAQLILKLVYFAYSKGIQIRSLKSELEKLTNVRFAEEDIQQSLNWLENTEKKVYKKNGRYRIKPEALESIKKEVKQVDENISAAVNHWFSESETFKKDRGEEVIREWFSQLLIDFFKDYSYDWIRDLMPKRKNGEKKTPNIERIIDQSLLVDSIEPNDRYWLKSQFVAFVESNRIEDNQVLWNYGSARFSATLLTARNFADDFGLDEFRGAKFILDTNILMILELEAYEKVHALKSIEDFFISQNIQPIYFPISRAEYIRAIGPKRDATLSAFEKYSFNVFKETDCVFVKTAIRRECITREDFEQFFNQIMDVPSLFFERIKLKCEDSIELDKTFREGEEDDKLKNKINTVYKRRTGNDKRATPKKHDAALYRATSKLRTSEKAIILTRDSILREFAYEDAVRDELPLAIGIDSLIQMLALNAGGTQGTSTNFIPLFSKIVQLSLYPEKDMFKPEDLEYILKSRINVHNLTDEQIVSIAKKINKLRYSRSDDDDIQLEIRRLFDISVDDIRVEVLRARDEKIKALEASNAKAKELDDANRILFDTKYENMRLKLKQEVIVNWIKLIGIGILTLALVFLCLWLPEISSIPFALLFSVITGLLTTAITYLLGFKGKLVVSDRRVKELLK